MSHLFNEFNRTLNYVDTRQSVMDLFGSFPFRSPPSYSAPERADCAPSIAGAALQGRNIFGTLNDSVTPQTFEAQVPKPGGASAHECMIH